MCLFNLRTRDPSSIMKKEHVLDNDFMHTPKNDKEKEGYESYQKSGSIDTRHIITGLPCRFGGLTWRGYSCPFVYVSTNGSGNGQDRISAARHMIGLNTATDSIITHFHSNIYEKMKTPRHEMGTINPHRAEMA